MLLAIPGLAGGEEASLPGFGKFKVKETPERDGRNPTCCAPNAASAAPQVAPSIEELSIAGKSLGNGVKQVLDRRGDQKSPPPSISRATTH